jgi:hypothetical protein
LFDGDGFLLFIGNDYAILNQVQDDGEGLYVIIKRWSDCHKRLRRFRNDSSALKCCWVKGFDHNLLLLLRADTSVCPYEGEGSGGRCGKLTMVAIPCQARNDEGKAL